jgi:DDE superfamily endonuclease
LVHYQAYGINIQATCDYRRRFVEVAVVAPGGCNDARAFRKCSLSGLVDNLPIGKHVVGDNAYGCCENLLTPFQGQEKENALKDAYNYHLSLVRIKIEMTFGLMVTKWRILKSPLHIPVADIGELFLAITRLQNYCINEHPTAANDTPSICREIAIDSIIAPRTEDITRIIGHSMMREIVMQNIQRMGIRRPDDNLL